MQEKLLALVAGVCEEVFPGVTPRKEVVVERPSDMAHGDYATNAALAFSGNPKDNADKILSVINKNLPDYLSGVSVAGPGFINFTLSPKYLSEVLTSVIKEGPKFGHNPAFAGLNILTEYTDPNPFKEFHIGHLMPNVIGESISRLLECAGARVERMSYQGDVGLHIGKAVWGMIHNPQTILDSESLAKKTAYLGQSYVVGSKAYEESEENKKEIQEINEKIFKRSDAEINELYDRGKRWSLEHFEEIYKILGTAFDHYVFESEVAGEGQRLVRANLGKVFEESDGAVVYKGEKNGLHTRVFLNKQGLPTYEAKDLALALYKFSLREWDLSLTITGKEQNDYFRVMLSALSEIAPEVAGRIRHMGHGLLRFATGKMSSREGNVVTGESLINDTKELVRQKMKESEVPEDKREEVENMVAVAAIKFSILKQGIGKDIIFDFDQSISFEGDSGPYLQYTAVRANSVLGKTSMVPDARNSEGESQTLARFLAHFRDVMERSAREYAPQLLVTYLLELASAFNSFYASNKIIGSEKESYRLALTKAVAITMENGLGALGIKTPKVM
ncbi:MAG: arginine--tRNA ligase [Patescibacteria group bacterium]